MKKKSLVYILAIALILPLTSCTSGGSKEGGDAAQQAANDSQFSQEGEGDFAKTQGDGNPQSQLQTDGAPAGQAKTDTGAPPQDTGQDLALDGQQKPAAGGGGKDELSLDDPQPLPDGIAGTQDPAANAAPATPPADAPPADKQASAAPPTDEPLFKNDAKPEEAGAAPGGDTAAAAPPADAAPAAPKTFAPLQKVKDAAFDKDGTNLNRYYVARAEDKSVKAVSKKIYGGKDRSKELKAWNSVIAKRAPRVGDKIYYQSEANPTDTQMLSYYEEAGIQPKVYTTQEGDNLRKLSKSWLGSKDSWKEVWETNAAVDSKGDVPAGLQIKYWPSDAASSVAKNETAPPEAGSPAPPPDIPPPPPGDVPPPPPNMADTGAPPPPPPGSMPPGPSPASTPETPPGGAAAIAPPPPPPPDQGAPPPPPPPPAPEAKKPMKAPVAKDDASNDPDTTMAMGLGAILLIAAAVLFVVLRKNRAKRVDLGQTQV